MKVRSQPSPKGRILAGLKKYRSIYGKEAHKVPADLCSATGYTALHEAAASNDIDSFEMLIEYGADPNEHSIIDNYSNAYMFAKKGTANLILAWFEKHQDKHFNS